jgi:hypothetical protein
MMALVDIVVVAKVLSLPPLVSCVGVASCLHNRGFGDQGVALQHIKFQRQDTASVQR